MADSKTNTFNFRLKRKWNEHRQQDFTGFSFCRYAFKWTQSRLKRKISDTAHAPSAQYIQENADVIQLAVRITGGLGDYIVLSRVLRDLIREAGPLELYLFLPNVGFADWAFAGVPGIAGVFPEVFMERCKLDCDCALYLNSFVFFDEENIDIEKLRRLSPRLLKIIASTIRNRRNWNIFIDNHPTLDGAFARQASAIGKNRYSFIHSILGIASGGLLLPLPIEGDQWEEIHKQFPVYITINTGFDHMFVISTSRATKCWPDDHWKRLVVLLKKQFPSLGIVQIGGSNSVHIPGCDFDFSGKIPLAESAGILKHSRLHVDIEGGLVHVAASIGTKSLVLFGPTSKKYFAYQGNIALSCGDCGDCWWATERWMECCPGKKEISCMEKLSPEMVFEAVRDELNTNGAVNETH